MGPKKIVSGIFGGKGTPAYTYKSWDALHSFSTRSSDGFGGKMTAAGGWAGGKVSEALQQFYKQEKLNPCITAIKITVDPVAWTTAWEVTIEESPDGKAYMGLNSWGGASGGYPKNLPPSGHAYGNYLKELANVASVNPGADMRNVIDFYIPGGFRQIFFQYTIPKRFKNLPKSANAKTGTVGVKIGPEGSPKNLPLYNGVLFPCVTITDDPNAEEAKKAEEQAKKEEEKKAEDAQKGSEEERPSNQGPPDPRVLAGKFQLKVKSGPGVIIGVTEVEIKSGVADFSGIQFDQPGDYVISVSSDSPDIDSAATEIKLKVNPAPDAIPQDPKGNTASTDTGNRVIISQIKEPNADLLKINPMAFDKQQTDKTSTVQVATSIGSGSIFVSYNGSQINDRDIVSFKLYHEGMLPKVDITFRDSNGMIAKEPPRDNTCFEIYIDPKSDHLKKIHLKMQIVNHSKLPNNAYQFQGTLFVPDLYRIKFKVYRGTSFNVLKQICENMGLGFNSNIVNTNDEMPWRNIGDKQFKFMEEIVKHSYISDESFMAGYIDYYYCFNYVDVEKEMNRDISKDECIDTGTFETKNTEPEKLTKLVLSTEKGQQLSNLYFIKTAERNESTKTSMEQGYKTRTKFYDKVKKMFLVFDVDSTTTDGSKTHILKGEAGDTEAFENNYVTKYEGKIDTDNTHKNYNYAVTQNRINLDNMVKCQMDITLPNPNLCLYKYMKVMAVVVKDNASPTAPEAVQWRWSGEWLISDMSFESIGGKMSQKITLVRKELGKDPEEIKKNDSAAKQEKKEEKNENPISGSQSSAIAKPNEAYKPGEEYTVQDSQGKKFIVKITSLSENGNEVKAEIRDIDYVYPASNQGSLSGVTQSGTQSVAESATQSATQSAAQPSNENWVYPHGVVLERVSWATKDELPQMAVTSRINSHATFYGGKYETVMQNIMGYNHPEFYIAIKRPIPDFKPKDWEKKMTPFSWVLFSLNDYGIEDEDQARAIIDKAVYKYEIPRHRLLYETEPGISNWTKDSGYVRILNSSGKEVWSSLGSSNSTTGNEQMVHGRQNTGNDVLDRLTWYPDRNNTLDTDAVPDDQLYTYVGGENVIYIDMSNPAIFEAGTYTIEVKYNVPLYQKINSDGENQGKPYNGKGGWYVKPERVTEPKDEKGHAPFKSIILRETFTISRRSQRK